LEEQVERTMPEKVLGVNLYPLQSQKLPDQMIVKALRTRQEHKAMYSDREFEPLRPVRWAANAEFERASNQYPEHDGK
ncbi:MAG: hypothetical protein RL754_122, partial [Bacteroidota bacterium]